MNTGRKLSSIPTVLFCYSNCPCYVTIVNAFDTSIKYLKTTLELESRSCVCEINHDSGSKACNPCDYVGIFATVGNPKLYAFYIHNTKIFVLMCIYASPEKAVIRKAGCSQASFQVRMRCWCSPCVRACDGRHGRPQIAHYGGSLAVQTCMCMLLLWACAGVTSLLQRLKCKSANPTTQKVTCVLGIKSHICSSIPEQCCARQRSGCNCCSLTPVLQMQTVNSELQFPP